jgi:hypothetical protein
MTSRVGIEGNHRDMQGAVDLGLGTNFVSRLDG